MFYFEFNWDHARHLKCAVVPPTDTFEFRGLVPFFLTSFARPPSLTSMDIMVRIPDDLAGRLGTAGEVERRALEAAGGRGVPAWASDRI